MPAAVVPRTSRAAYTKGRISHQTQRVSLFPVQVQVIRGKSIDEWANFRLANNSRPDYPDISVIPAPIEGEALVEGPGGDPGAWPPVFGCGKCTAPH